MANYVVTDHVIVGTPEEVAAAAEAYLETLDSTSQSVISVNIVGTVEHCKMIILHNDAA